MAILHKIKAYLYDNALTKDNPNDFIARTVSERSLNVKQICEAAVNRGGSDVSAPSMQHATELFLKEMAYQLCDGFSVNTGYFTASTLIRGVFEIPTIEIDILGVADASAAILQVTDVKSGSVNDLLTPNRNLKIAGSKIKIAGEDVANGVYFVDATTQTRTAVEASDIVTNNPSELIIVIPALAAGTYTIEVVTQYAQGSLIKEPRTATFDKTLTVQ